MRRIIIPLVILLFPFSLKSQDIRLEDCIRESLDNFALSANKDLAVQIGDVKQKIVKSAWLPGLDLNGQATWQSDVVILNLDLPFPVNLPSIPKDQYRVTTDITQLIYDGGSIKNQQNIEKINTSLSVQDIRIREYELKQAVEDLYFAVLVTGKKIEVLGVMAESLRLTIQQVESGIKNGVLSESDLPLVRSEQIALEQKVISLNSLKMQAIKVLGLLMNRELPAESEFIQPQTLNETRFNGLRPEYQLFELQNNLLDAQMTLLNSQRKPKIMAFGQAGYGKPGLNFMGDKWDPYLLLGLKGTWTIWDWRRVQRQKETLGLSQRVLANQQEAFTRRISQAEEKQLIIIGEINQLLAKDEELVTNRAQVTQAYDSRLKNGLITASQYVSEWTREQEARINQEVRKIELVSSEYKLLSIKGKY